MSDTARTPLILVVDDNHQNLQLIGGIMGESLEFDLSFATSGSEALQVMETITPDLVLLDINMPGMSGFEVCRRIRENIVLADIPVIFLTAQGETEFIVKGFRCGGSDYVIKPFEPQELLARVRVQLELHWSRTEMKRLNDELQRLNEELRLLSSTDGLLRIANRRYFDEALTREWQRASRNSQPLSLLMIDVDHFKRYNDRYGHLEGDACLKQMAGIVSRNVHRATDLVARYGGEELAVLLPETTSENALLVAEMILESVRAERIRHEDSPVAPYVTVSIGVAGAVPLGGMLPESLLLAADGALYAAKEKGRDRSCLAQLEMGGTL